MPSNRSTKIAVIGSGLMGSAPAKAFAAAMCKAEGAGQAPTVQGQHLIILTR